jgi:spore maturation protein CgeB
MKKIYLMNSPELPTPGTHYYTTSKFSRGFERHGYTVIEAKTLDSIEDGSIVLLSNHGIDEQYKEKGLGYLKYLNDKYPNTIFICWFYHKYYNEIPFKKFILTGEHFHEKPLLDSHIFCWDLQNRINNYMPLTFSSSILLEDVGNLIRNDTLNGCFIGTPYKPDWVEGLSNIKYITTRHFPENERINLFLSSKIAFGFHADANILNNVVVERIFEGMSYGCVVISDSPAAAKITDNIVQLCTSKEEFLQVYNRILNNDEERKLLQQRGYEWIKKKGLYSHVAEIFLNKCKELGFIN